MVTKMFKDQIEDIVEVYIGDMVVKSKRSEEHVSNLVRVFEKLRHHKLHLNAGKCAFGVGSDKFLGYMITTRGIEINFDLIMAIQQLNSSSNLKKCRNSLG